jgi:hypothetical protein
MMVKEDFEFMERYVMVLWCSEVCVVYLFSSVISVLTLAVFFGYLFHLCFVRKLQLRLN